MEQSSKELLISDNQLVVLLIGSIVPLGGYFLNKYAPWASESVKGVVQVVLMGVAGGLYTVLATDITGFENIAQQCLSSIVAGLFAHNTLWKPADVNIKFGAEPPG